MTKIPLKDSRMFSLADDQDKDGLKLENVGPTFHCRNALKIDFFFYNLVQPFVVESLVMFL